MKTEHEMVREFMRAFGQRMPERAALPDVNTMELRADLIREELEELVAAYTITDYFDAILDLLYVVHGAAAAAGSRRNSLRPVSRRSTGAICRRCGRWRMWPHGCLTNTITGWSG